MNFQLQHVHISWVVVAVVAGMAVGDGKSKKDSFPNGHHTLSQTVM
jgi:hypothetical protein